MTLDHIGYLLLPQYPILRIIGRLAFPIFSYMIAEGCRYTKNRTKYLLTMIAFGTAFQVVYFIVDHSLFQGVFVSFSLGIAMIFAVDNAIKRKTAVSALIAILVSVFIGFICLGLSQILSHTDFAIDYGVFGVLLPVLVYFAPNKLSKLIAATVAVIGMSLLMGGRQWYALSAIVLLALYNEKRGTNKLKHLFYLYYPLHLIIIYGIDMLY